MESKRELFIINGSASLNSSNKKLIDNLVCLTKNIFNTTIFNELKSLPHFDPERSIDDTPQIILDFRQKIQNADGIIICTPEYIFSIPSGLKNAIEWCVSTTVFSGKPIGIITASANGQKGHEELQLIMRTVMTNFSEKTTLLLQGIKGKINEQGKIIDGQTSIDLKNFIEAFKSQVDNAYQ